MKLRIRHEIFHFTPVIDRDSWADNNRKERDSTVISDVLVVSTERWEELHDKVQWGFYTNRPRGCSRGLADSYQRHQTSSVQRRTGLSKGHEAGGREKISRLHIVHLKNCVVLLIELICWYSFLFENIIFNHFRLFMFAVELTILMMQKRFLIASFHRALIKGQKTKRWDYGTTAQWGKLDVWSSQNES